MIVVNLSGGLGNQMFQYACGRAMSIRLEQPFRIATDQFDDYLLHNGFELHRVFNVNDVQAKSSDLQKILGWQRFPKIRWLLGRPSMSWARNGNWCAEPKFEYWPDIENALAPLYLHGYWQSENYFKDFSEQIRQDFSFRLAWDIHDIAVHERMKAQPSASIHIRRGDYITNKNKKIFARCDFDYYLKSVSLLRDKIPEIKLFAFSDDPQWVERYLIPELGEMDIIRHNFGARSSNDMRLMSLANHHIIANSTFGWWGAWLNPSPNKIVIAPKKWFINGTNDYDLIPSSWIRL